MSCVRIGVFASCLLACSSPADGDAESGSTTGSETDTQTSGPTTSATSQTTTVGSTSATDATTGTDPTMADSSVGAMDSTGTDTSGSATDPTTESDTDPTGADLPPSPSPGCGVSQIQPGTLMGIVVNGNRTFNIVVPDAHDGVTPIPFVVAFHGWTLNAAIQAQMSQMSVTANDRGFSVAYAQGIGDSWNAGSCCGVAFDQQVDDIAFARAIVDNAAENLCIDMRRVYATGFSNGGFMSHRLACQASDVFAAIGPVAGVIMIPDEECTPERPMPVMHFHGTADTSVAYGGNGMVPHISVPLSTEGWVNRNGCDPDSAITYQQDDTTCETWSNCGDDGAVVTLCTIEGMGHCWPGDPQCLGGNETPSVTLPASEALADFFAAHPMP